MKTIKIFIASSKELERERLLMASLANELSTRLEKVGIQVIAIEWESLDASMGELHKQEEYNEKLRECDMCMVLYWTTFGMYTKTELDTAYKEKIAGNNPKKVWVYFKEINDPEKETSEELKEFRDSFPTKYGHFYTPFANFDTLKAHFLLQFMEYQSQALQGKSIVEVKDGKITVNGKEYVDLQNVPFAGNNEEYNDIREEIKDLQEDIENMSPDNPRYAKKAEKLLRSKEKLAKMESNLWDTALMITRLSTTKCSERLQRAMDLFNQGDNKGAQAILNEEEIEKDVQHNLNLIKLGEEGKKGLKTNIDEYLLKIRIYENEFRLFELCDLCERVLQLTISLYGEDAEDTAWGYHRLGIVYSHIEDNPRALDNYQKALKILEKKLGGMHLDTASLYNDIGNVYLKQGDYPQALKFHQKSLEINEMLLGNNHPITSRSYNNIGGVYLQQGNYSQALEYYQKTMEINEKALGVDHPDTATAYNNIGIVYMKQADYTQALEFYLKALKIREKELGFEHPDTADLYNNIGLLYSELGDNSHAQEYHQKALKTRRKLFGNEHPDTARSYNNLGIVNSRTGDYSRALECYQKALIIKEKVLGFEHPDTIRSFRNIIQLFLDLGADKLASQWHEKAIEWYLEAAKQGDALSQNHLGVKYQLGQGVVQNEKMAFELYLKAAEGGYSVAQRNLGLMYAYGCGTGQNYEMAIKWYRKSIAQGYKEAYNDLAWTYHLVGKYQEALPWAEKAKDAFPNNPDNYDTLATIYWGLERFNEAMKQFEQCLMLYKEQKNVEGIKRTEEKIAELKDLINNDSK